MKKNPAAVAGVYQQFGSAFASILVLPLLIKGLGAYEAGLWISFQAIIAFGNLCDFGFGYVITRQIAFSVGGGRVDSNISPDIINGESVFSIIKAARFLNGLASGFCLVALGVVGLLIWLNGSARTLSLIDFSLIWFCLSGSLISVLFTRPDLSFMEGAGYLTLARIILGSRAILIALTSALAVIFGYGLVGLSILCLLVTTLTVIYQRLLANRLMERYKATVVLNRKVVWSIVKIALPLGVVNVGAFLFSAIQVPLIALFMSPSVVGSYFVAQRVYNFTSQLILQYPSSLIPKFSMAVGAGEYENARRMMGQGVSVAALSILALIFSGVILPFVSEFIFHSKPVGLLVLGLMAVDNWLSSLNTVVSWFVLASGKNPFLWAVLASGVANVILVYSFMGKLGLLALPLASVTAGLAFAYFYCALKGQSIYRKLGQGI